MNSMNSMKQWLVCVLVSTTLVGCATSYTGPRPDFTKTGDAAIAEYKKFEIDETFGGVNLGSIDMGNKSYYRETVTPIISDVSSSAIEKLNKMRMWNNVNLAILAVTLLTIFQPQDSWERQTGYWIGLGGIIGTGIYINRIGMDAAADYNRDLRSKFNPSLNFTTTF